MLILGGWAAEKQRAAMVDRLAGRAAHFDVNRQGDSIIRRRFKLQIRLFRYLLVASSTTLSTSRGLSRKSLSSFTSWHNSR